MVSDYEILEEPTAEMTMWLQQSGSNDRAVAQAAQRNLAKALEVPLRQGVLKGDILGNVFSRERFAPGTSIEYPLDMLAPGTEKDHVAYTIPGHGRIPERHVESDVLVIQTYMIGSSIDWLLKYAREVRWNIVGRAMGILEASFVRKLNDDGWKTILAAGVDRNIVTYDAAAAAGVFTKRLVSLMKITMRREAGGNTGTPNRGRLTDLYMSPEGMEDIREWGTDQIDEVTRREIFQMDDGTLMRIFQVNLHELDELGEGREYQNYYTNVLGASLAVSDVELVVGLDLSSNDSFVMPIRQEVEIFEDETLHRQQRAGFYGWGEFGFGVLDNRRVLLGSF